MVDVPEEASNDLALAEALRWGMSGLASRLRAEQPGDGRSLTRLAASVLANLRHRGALSPSKLAAIEGLQTQSLTRVLNELEEEARIRRSRSEVDARRQNIELTEAGREALREHVRDGNAWLAAALGRTLSPAERGVLRIAAGLLEQVAQAEAAVEGRRGPAQTVTQKGGRRRQYDAPFDRQGGCRSSASAP
ncbi:MarR family transcriptional regulator [Streptomyces sp. CT34]|uniref:MarR family winged helix-turn-helix transcriptional regulator n=1 Tax=Streptomyces sp. CT34 TaxID=1553907 RepID=UPI0007C6D8B9|nr:MarR family transcriptional regulator [Streptomyces sp. CT34]